MRRSEQTTIKTSCPRDCYDSCGISAIVIDGKINRVLGDSDHEMTHGALCAKWPLSITVSGLTLKNV